MAKGNLAKANALYSSGAFNEALELYETIAKRPGWEVLVRANIKLCLNRIYGLNVMVICLRLGNHDYKTSAIGDHLAMWLEIFRRRFTARVVLGMAGFDQIPPEQLAEWIAKGLLEQTVCSGHEDFILNDLIAAAAKTKTQRACFFDVRNLLADMVGSIRFLVESTKSREKALIDRSEHSLYLSADSLLQMIPVNLKGPWAISLKEIYRKYSSSPKVDLREMLSASEADRHNLQCHCFATVTGVRRLGGFAKFLNLPLKIGGIAVADFDQYWFLDTAPVTDDSSPVLDNGSNYAIKRVPAIWAPTVTKSPVVFDLCPAPNWFESASDDDSTGFISAPRQVIIGRRCVPLEDEFKSCNDQSAIFIVSNYNKRRYLHSSLYSLMMQSHPRIRIEVVDDVSTDDSMARIQSFCILMSVPDGLVVVRNNPVGRGTYWIRNYVTSKNLKTDAIFFVNDSDDYSTALRATLQLAALEQRPESLGSLFDIVRVSSSYLPLMMNGEIERYGTASLCYKPELIKRVGYFQNIRKNADTEFIERVRRFESNHALPWCRYPVLFQPFDGGNLTADIYEVEENGATIITKKSKRDIHAEIFRKHHSQLKHEELKEHFSFPLTVLLSDYAQLGNEFLIDGELSSIPCHQGDNMKDNESYWIKRHQHYVDDVRSVGNMAKTIPANLAGYGEKIRRLRSALLARFSSIQGLKILEIGCGIGMMACDLINNGGNYTGIDISPHALDQAITRAPAGKFICSNAYDYKLQDQFDVVFCTDVLVHLVSDENWLNALKSMKQHMKLDGVIIIKEVIHEDRRTPSPHVVSRSLSEYLSGCELIGLDIQPINSVPGFYFLEGL